MKKIIFAFCILIICLLGYLTYKNFIKPVSINEIKNDNVFSFYLNDEKKTYNDNSDWYEIKVEYPSKNQKVSDLIFKNLDQFVKETGIKNYKDLKSAKEGLQIDVDGLKYSYFAEYTIATSSDYITYVYTIYNFTGGAHGSSTTYPITFNKKNEIVSAEQLLPTSSLEKVSKIATEKIKIEKFNRLKTGNPNEEKDLKKMIETDDMIKDGVKPVRDNYNVVWPVGENQLNINFGQYQVGAYVEGIYDIQIPMSEISATSTK